MLCELHVRDLGVIDDLTVLLGPGMTALTGETGAGKTMIVEAIGLLLGEKADPMLVRPGAAEATVEARFCGDADDRVLSRVVPAAGRSRAYVDGRMAPLAALAEAGAGLVDLHAHTRTPGYSYKEDFLTASQSAAAGGITTLDDIRALQAINVHAALGMAIYTGRLDLIELARISREARPSPFCPEQGHSAG